MELRVRFLPGEYFWGGSTVYGIEMPLHSDSVYDRDFRKDNRNQTTPLFLSNKGRYVWSENIFRVWVEQGELCFDGLEEVVLEQAGETLKDAYIAACRKHFPFTGKTLPREFFRTAQYNTWMQFTYYPTQEGVLKYAHDIVDNGFAPGIFIIDEGWHGRYGFWEFDKLTFPDPKAMVDELHDLGFTVMLWITPLVTADGPDFIRKIRPDFNPETYDTIFLRDKKGEVALIKWWEGYSALLDFRKECDRTFFMGHLNRLMRDYGVDGFKFDGGSHNMYRSAINAEMRDDFDPKEMNIAWNSFHKEYKFHEYKDTFMGMGNACIQRLCDRRHRWKEDGIDTILPSAIMQGLMGYPFICPDMIGGGGWTDRALNIPVDEELFVRMAQVSALFPMMQFSWAPWEALSETSLQLLKDAAKLHQDMADELIALLEETAVTGEPVLRNLEYNDPGQGFETVNDQFMLGEDILVCPVVTKGTFEKEVVFPEGTWQDADGNCYCGRCRTVIPTPLEKLAWFRRVKK